MKTLLNLQYTNIIVLGKKNKNSVKNSYLMVLKKIYIFSAFCVIPLSMSVPVPKKMQFRTQGISESITNEYEKKEKIILTVRVGLAVLNKNKNNKN